MNSSSISYLILAISLLSFIFFCYFKILHYNTSENNSNRDRIIGNMKNEKEWRIRNNRMSFVFLFWTIVSLAAFIYLKYYFSLRVISSAYIIVYFILIVTSTAVAGTKRKAKT